MTGDLEEMLADGMARYAETVSMPDGLLHAARARRRRRLGLRACIAAGTGLAVAATTVILASGGAKSEQPRMLTDAYVVKEVQAALTATGSNDGMVMHATSEDTIWAKGKAAWAAAFGASNLPLWTKGTWWSYQSEELIGEYSAQGTLKGETEYVVSPTTVTSVDVSYVTRTWGRNQWTIGSPVLPGAPSSVHGQPFPPSCEKGGYSLLSDLSWPAYLKSALVCGDFRYAGQATLNGRQVLVLDNSPSRHVSHVAEKLWVDPKTYLPIRETWQIMPGPEMGFIEPGTFDPVQTDFQWLPPTPANIASATISIPAGFSEVHSFGGT